MSYNSAIVYELKVVANDVRTYLQKPPGRRREWQETETIVLLQ